MVYKELQRKLQVQKLRYKHPELFNQDNGGGKFDKYDSLPFILLNGLNNLYSKIQSPVVPYFEKNDIAWWGDNEEYPTGHLLSSQMQCLNFLFALRNNKQAVLALAKLFDSEIDDVLETIKEYATGYIAFEFVFENEKLLGENDFGAKRGSKCTSIDAFIIALRKGKKILIPLEWKYTETYLKCENKSTEPGKGKVRQNRYNHLIVKSSQLKTPVDFEDCIYYYEPFYELMRQTLLAEQMILQGIGDDILHIVVIPNENTDLLGSNYSFSKDDFQTTWRKSIVDQEKFKVIDSKEILQTIENLPNYTELANYITQRYY